VKPCLIFDLDGTLVDSLDGIAASLNRSLTAHGLPGHSHANVRSFVGDGLKMLVERSAPRGAALSLIESLIAIFKKDYEQSWQHGTTAYPGIFNLLDELQKDGFAMAVLSNKTHDFTVAMTRALFPKIHFASILGQRDGIPHKPHPAGAFQIAAVLGAAPENCRIIGDSTIDMETAANADMQPIAVTWGYHDRVRLIAAGAEHIIDHPSELPALIG
jgi:phosphoglycolate phosphatase